MWKPFELNVTLFCNGDMVSLRFRSDTIEPTDHHQDVPLQGERRPHSSGRTHRISSHPIPPKTSTSKLIATYCFYGMVRYYFLQQPFLYCSNLDFASENAKTIAHVGSSFRFHRSSSTSSTSKSTGSSSIPSCSSYASRTAK